MPNQTSDFYPRPLRHLSSYLSGLVQGKLWLKVLIGMFLGLITGTLLGPSVGLVEKDEQINGVLNILSNHRP